MIGIEYISGAEFSNAACFASMGINHGECAISEGVPTHAYDVQMNANQHVEIDLPSGYNTGLFVHKGSIVLNQSHEVGGVEFVLCSASEDRVGVQAKEEAMLLVLSGEPINESVVWSGPFVMNTQQEVAQAMEDYRLGKMGHLD